MAILDAGAYGSVMASTYNRRPLLPEVLIDERPATQSRRHDDTSHDGDELADSKAQTIDELCGDVIRAASDDRLTDSC